MNLIDGKQHQILNELYVEACADLLSDYGLTVDIEEQRAERSVGSNDSCASILGATGEWIRLTSTLRIKRDPTVSKNPADGVTCSVSDSEDWCRELNNQLVGRVKNKLLGYGQVLMVLLPVLLTEADLTPVVLPNSKVNEYSIESAQGQIILTLTTLVTPDLQLSEVEPPTGEEAVLLEGAVALF